MGWGVLHFFHALSSICYWHFNDNHSDYCEVVHRCSFDLNFSLLVMLNIILYAYEPSLCFLWKYVYLGLLLGFFCCILCFFFFLLLSCMSCLYILEINPLLFTPFANVSSHSVDCFSFCFWFPLLWKSLWVWLCSFFIFAFISIALGDWSMKILLWFMSENVLLYSLLVLSCHVLYLKL